RLRAGLFDVSGLNQLWLGSEVTYTVGELVDLGTMPVPPGQWGSGYGQVMLKIWSEVATGTYNLDLDYAALLPTDAWRAGITPGMVWSNGNVLVVDEIEGTAYATASSVRYPYLTVSGTPLMLTPGVTQRLVQLEAPSTGTGAINHTFSVKLYYRPRRATI
ncbi:MAG: hypothetical protein ACRC1H_18885, partial [Caldilineaceae bacterium]